tara:strand:- start:675 stop:1814 length:1140 start_codon:yes stop_codon:yes gene_type:complete
MNNLKVTLYLLKKFKKKYPILILGSVRDYHAVDWYMNLLKINSNIIFISDCNSGEGINNQMPKSHKYIQLISLDILLFKSQTKLANIWRNFLKIFILPFNSLLLKIICIKLKPKLIHAHPLYYGAMCRLVNQKYILTPQGSEILVRPFNNYLYKIFAQFSLKGAIKITVDSEKMARVIKSIFNLDSIVIQNGIDTTSILSIGKKRTKIKNYILSYRSIHPNYRIMDIVKTRNKNCPLLPIYFIYPSFDNEYLKDIKKYLKSYDKLIGKVEKKILYQLMRNSLATISIPISDSSPKSVYESIFSGAPTILEKNSYQENMTKSMQLRTINTNLKDHKSSNWLRNAISKAYSVKQEYYPCESSIKKFDSLEVLKNNYLDLYT